MSVNEFWARLKKDSPAHVFSEAEADAAECAQLCSDVTRPQSELYERLSGAPGEEFRCRNCTKIKHAETERANAGKTEDAPIGPPRPTKPREVKPGDQVRCSYLVGGPRMVTANAWVKKVTRQKDGPPLLDLDCEPLPSRAAASFTGVSYNAAEPPEIKLGANNTHWRCFPT